ncbi:polysaccharide biosynthesis protein [Cellulomonas bogoriensis]|uniref:dTDP-glucose 4,6-dehydratase n=1 Tax=Cellulomonas bogoriensis 69B4 = DSM 16987 TaxID=1386082 RepID=A0A0A0BYL3_9CELL|nr:nucleoside-diphosphate sugar epimerase/dehydratase [Cellulomonas bogoriensis]KGM13503.1 dTDP-glucose 4,6-dehydratase [Cellulomonas bogoriensis 69B4 = DSM 16987]
MAGVRLRSGLDRRWRWALFDAGAWIVAVVAATWLRYDFEAGPALAVGTFLFAGLAVLAHLIVGSLIGPYVVGHQRGSFEEVADLAVTVAVVTPPLLLWTFVVDPIVVPRSIPVVAAVFALMGMCTARYVFRTFRSRRQVPAASARRVVVFGAGDAGRALVRSMRADGGYAPVALLDDDPDKRLLTIDGVRVLGGREALAAVARRKDATTLVIAVPEADSGLIRELSDLAGEARLDVQVLPPLRDMIGRPTTADLRNLNLADLLGRGPVDLDLEAIAAQITGRTVLVTGAGGSIGSELCRQIARFTPGRLYMLDRDESGLQATQMSLKGHGLLDDDQVVLADIRDLDALRTLFSTVRPDLVFHAAALKHLPLLESHPLEGWKTNVLGTYNVLTAAAEAGVGTFVNISTDKAANPTSVLGLTKRLTERLTAAFAARHAGRFVSVRFGNVLGSRGSVVHLFTAQIERGGPVTVTHPEAERFFMLIPEACQLVLEAASIGHDGEVMVLEMGDQVKIVEVARTLIRLSGRRDVDITFTGLRPGEKLSEELFAGGDDSRPTSNALVNAVDVPPLDPATVLRQAFLDHHGAATWMRAETERSDQVGAL